MPWTNPMKTLLASLALLLPVAAQAAPGKTAAKPMAVCVAKATGVVTARPKCKAGESPLSLAAVAASAVGPQGPQGPTGPKGDTGAQGPAGKFSLSGCYGKTGTAVDSTNGLAVADVRCNDEANEFAISNGFAPNVPFAVLDGMIPLRDSANVPVGLRVIAYRSDSGAFTLQGIIVCCKR